MTFANKSTIRIIKLLIAIIFLFTTSNIYSQPKKLNAFFEDEKFTPSFLLEKDFSKNIFEDEKFENILSKTILSQEFESTSIVDSAIITEANGGKEKYTYTLDLKKNRTLKSHASWNGVQFVNDGQSTWTYDSDGNITQYLGEKWDGNNWTNGWRSKIDYSNKNMILYFCDSWDSNQWVNELRGAEIYDSQGNNTSDFVEVWNVDKWENSWRETSTYDLKGNITSYFHEKWNVNRWEKYQRTVTTYNKNGNKISVLEEHWLENQITFRGCRFFTFDDKENKTSYLSQNWYNSQWENNIRITYTYNSHGDMISNFGEIWKENMWINNGKSIYNYDSNGNITLQLYEWWDGSKWLYTSRHTDTYNSNGNRISDLWEEWDGNIWTNYFWRTYNYNAKSNFYLLIAKRWENDKWIMGNSDLIFNDSFGNLYDFSGSEIEIFYSTITDIKETESNISEYSLSQNYPNPFNPSTTIKYQIPPNIKNESANTKLVVYDMLGREVATLVNEQQSAGNYEVQFNANDLSSGVYFYKIQSRDFVESKKMILIK